MLGIIIKDYYETFCLKKNIIGMLFSLSVVVLIVAFLHNLYSFILIVGITLPMMGASTLQSSLEQDEISKYDQILLTFPITKKKIVDAKLIATTALSLMTNFFVSLPISLIYIFLYQVTDFKTGMLIWFVGLILSFMMNAINSMGFFWLGNKKGAIVYSIMIIVIVIGYFLINLNFDMEILLQMKISTIILISILITIILNLISYFACIKIYTKKHS